MAGKPQLRFFLLLAAHIAGIVLLFFVVRRPLTEAALGPAFQSFAWKQMGPLRTFALVQVFWSGAFFWLAGMGGGLLRERRSWIYLLLSVICAFIYIALDPWSVEGQGRMLIRGITQFAFAVFLWQWICRCSTERSWSSFFLALLAFFLSCGLFVVLLRVLTHETFHEAIRVSDSDILLYGILSSTAALLVESKHPVRERDALVTGREIFSVHRTYLRSLFVAVLAYVLIGACLAGLDSLMWSLLSPIIPILATAYASYRWFSLGGQAVEIPGALVAQRPELFLGIFFQYLSIVLVLSIYFTLRRPPSYLRYGVSHLMLLLYWSPSWWLLSQL